MKLFWLLLTCGAAFASDYVEGDFKTPLIPRPVPYSVLMPEGPKDGKPLPLMLYLHGGGGSRDNLKRVASWFDEMWKAGTLPKMIVVTPSVTPRCFYMDYPDGSEKWETMLLGPFTDFLQKTYNATSDPKLHFVMGASMGGMGGLRMAFKHPDKLGVVIALEPGIEPILHWKDMQPRHRFWREDSLFEAAYGKPVDPVYWEANNPASIAKKDAKRLIDSGVKIYLEVGDEDLFLLNEGTEFLHRVLSDSGIRHEYHLVYGADHVGKTLRPRHLEGLAFLNRILNPPGPDPQVIQTRKQIDPLRSKAGVK